MTEADAGEIIVPPRRQNRPMRPAYSQSTTNRNDEWVIGGKANYRLRINLSESDVQCSRKAKVNTRGLISSAKIRFLNRVKQPRVNYELQLILCGLFYTALRAK